MSVCVCVCVCVRVDDEAAVPRALQVYRALYGDGGQLVAFGHTGQCRLGYAAPASVGVGPPLRVEAGRVCSAVAAGWWHSIAVIDGVLYVRVALLVVVCRCTGADLLRYSSQSMSINLRGPMSDCLSYTTHWHACTTRRC